MRRQHGVITRAQLLERGLTRHAIDHRLANGRLRAIHAGVYAVGNLFLTQPGRWMAAVLACGDGAMLSHQSAAELWGIRKPGPGPIELSSLAQRRIPGLTVHRRKGLEPDHVRSKQGIRLTSVTVTIVDLARRLSTAEIEAMIGEADSLSLTQPEKLRDELGSYRGWTGVAKLRKVLDQRTFVLTHSVLERLFLPLVAEAGLPLPEGQVEKGNGRVDFWWDSLGLVVETDGLTYHRTAAKQSADLRRDHAHAAAGRTSLRFSHEQIRHEPGYVREQLAAVARRLCRV